MPARSREMHSLSDNATMPVEMPLPAPLYPRLLHLHGFVTEFRDEIGSAAIDPSREALRQDLVARLNGWLYELKLLVGWNLSARRPCLPIKGVRR